MKKLSQKMYDHLSQHATNGVTMGQLLDKMGSQGTGFLLALLALPLLVPLPPGVGTPFGILLFGWSLQRLFGVRVPWCPEFLRRRRLSPEVVAKVTSRGIPLIQKLERYGGGGAQVSETAEKAACIVVMVMAVLIIVPTPFLNPLFAFVILLLGVSMASASIRFFIAGITVGTAIVIFLLTIIVKTIQNDNLLFAFI